MRVVRNRAMSAVCLVAVAVLAASCGKPVGVDGNLVNGWLLPPDPKVPVPPAPACYNVKTKDPSDVAKWPQPLDCSQPHTVETVHVGMFDGPAAERTTPPPSGSQERRVAYEQCTARASEYLGGDWRTGRTELFLVLPTSMHWEAGDRSYRCDVLEYRDLEDFEVVSRSSSVRGGLLDGSPLRLTCSSIATEGDSVDRLLPVECTTRHNGEFAGIFDNPDGAYPTNPEVRRKANLDGCRGIVAAYAGIPNDKDFQYRVGQVATPFALADWELGNRGVRCYVWTPKDFTASVKGVGTAGLPINYA